MKLSISKIALIVGTPLVLLGYQNCAKLGTENLIGQTSSFVASGSTEIASSSPSATPIAPAEPTQTASRKNRYPSSDPMGDSKLLFAEVMQKCTGPEGKDEFVMESCLVLACQTPAQTVTQQKQMDDLCIALQSGPSA